VLHAQADHRPPRRHEHELWQLALEAVTNVERHAQARSVTVEYKVDATSVHLSIADDGIGLNSGAFRADRYGMIGMRERADSIGARLSVRPNQPRGTCIEVDLELLDEAHA
jgi:signal transduction histidine kinase